MSIQRFKPGDKVTAPDLSSIGLSSGGEGTVLEYVGNWHPSGPLVSVRLKDYSVVSFSESELTLIEQALDSADNTEPTLSEK